MTGTVDVVVVVPGPSDAVPAPGAVVDDEARLPCTGPAGLRLPRPGRPRGAHVVRYRSVLW